MLCWYFGQTRLHHYFKLHKTLTIKELRKMVRTQKLDSTTKEVHMEILKSGSTVDLHDVAPDFEVADHNQLDLTRTPGVGVFLGPKVNTTPRVFTQIVQRLGIIPKTVIFLTFEILHVPFVDPKQRVEVVDLGSDIYRVIARYGYSERASSTEAILCCEDEGLEIANQSITFFIHRESVTVANRFFLFQIPFYIYQFLKTTFGTASRFELPMNRVVEVGIQATL